MNERRSRFRKLVREAKSKPCPDCGNTYDPVCMDFDHRDPATKILDVNRMKYAASEEALLAEIAKCDVVCANCHRLRTARREQVRRAAEPTNQGELSLVNLED